MRIFDQECSDDGGARRSLTNGTISSYNLSMRRKPGAVLPLEASILSVGVDLAPSSTPQFHGFELATRLRDGQGGRNLTAHGTLYKALARMEKAGWLTSDWEDADVAAAEGRPRRRLYSITAEGRAALARFEAESRQSGGLDPQWSVS
jgi:PadR family transcriptional regulator PadR